MNKTPTYSFKQLTLDLSEKTVSNKEVNTGEVILSNVVCFRTERNKQRLLDESRSIAEILDDDFLEM